MELSVSCVSVVMLLFVFVHDVTPHRSEITVPRIVPSKLQLFDYTNLNVTCEGFFKHATQWKVVRNVSSQITACKRNGELFGPCHIQMVYPSDSGEYWCESKDSQRRSESIYITVKDGGVVLESPVRPVMVGDDVTLRCIVKGKKASSFYFYKDGTKFKSSPTGEMTIHNISESDQGLYRCSTSDGESSGENQLSVRAVLLQCPHRPVTEGTNVTLICTDKMAAPNHTALFFKDGETIGNSSSEKLTLRVSKSDEGVYKCRSSEGRESEEQWLAVRDGSVTSAGDVSDEPQPSVSLLVGLVALPLLLLVLCFIYKRHKGQRASGGSETYAVVTKPKNRAAAKSETTTIYSEISVVEEQSRAGSDPVSSRAEAAVYSAVNKPKNNSRGAEANAELYSTVDKQKKKKKKKDRGATEAAELYSVVKKNKGKKSAEDDCFYSQIR